MCNAYTAELEAEALQPMNDTAHFLLLQRQKPLGFRQGAATRALLINHDLQLYEGDFDIAHLSLLFFMLTVKSFQAQVNAR